MAFKRTQQTWSLRGEQDRRPWFTPSVVSGVPNTTAPQWESRQSQPTEGHTRFGTSWVVTRHDRSPSPMPFLAAAHPANDTSDTQPQPQVVTTSTREPTLSNLQGEPRIVSDTSVDDELRALSSLAGRQELAPGEVKLVESDFKREVEPLNLVSSRVVQDTEERKTIELKFQEKVQLVHYSFQLPSFAEFVEVPEEDLEKVRPLDSMGVGGVAANATPGEKQTVTERSPKQQQNKNPATTLLSNSKGAAGKVPAETGKGVTSTLVFPVDAKIETAQSETQRNVVSRTTVTVRQLSPGEGSTAADPTRSFLSPKPTEKTGKEDQNEEPMLVAPEPGTAEVDAAIAKSRISKSPPRGIAESTTDVGTAVRSATKELLSGAPQQPTDVKAFEKQEKETAEGHPKHLELQKKVSPYPSVIVTKTLPGQQDVDSGKPTPLSETDEKPVVKPLLSQPQPDNSSPLLASETRKLTDPESGERKATGDDVSANSSDPKQLKKSSKKKKKDHSPSPAPQVQDTKSSSNPLDRFGKKVKKFAMNLFSGDSKHPSEKSSHQDIIGVADTKTAISDGSKPQLQEDKKHKGKKKKGQKEQAIGHDDQPQYDRQQDGSKSDKPKVSTDEQSQNQYSQVLVTEEMSVIRSREYTPHTNEKTPKLNEATTRVHQEVPQARGKVTDTSDFKKPDQNEEQPHLVDKLKEETTELKSRSTQPMGQHDDDEKNLISELADIIRECRKDCPEPDIGSSPRKHPTSALIGLKEIPDKSDAHDLHPGKETKGKPKKPLRKPGSETEKPTKLPSREGTPGKKPTSTIFGWKETPEQPESDDKEPGKKKKGKPKKPSDEPKDQKEPDTVIITELTRIIQEGDKLPGFPGEPARDTEKPTKLPSREGTPGKKPTSTLIGWKETPEQPDSDDKEPGKKKKSKPKKPSDEPKDEEEPHTVVITELTRIVQEGDKLPEFPGKPGKKVTSFQSSQESLEVTPRSIRSFQAGRAHLGKKPTSTIFGWKETPEQPESDDKEPGKKKKGKPKKPSDEPKDQKEPDTVIITELTRIIQEGDKLPGFPGEPGSDTEKPTKRSSREGTPGKEPTSTIFGWKETPEQPDSDDKEPGKKKKGKPKKPSDEPKDQKEPDTVVITEVTRIIQEGDKLPEFPGKPGSDTEKPTKLPSREGTPGKEPTSTIFGWKETP
ncbi:hypothetical protein MRX96_011288 [Rhipicephalus microplus]